MFLCGTENKMTQKYHYKKLKKKVNFNGIAILQFGGAVENCAGLT